jgi:nucleotide-binding universal stress UspA family protein
MQQEDAEMRIMVCFDGSEAAMAALPVVRRLAGETVAEVHIVRVVQRDFSTGGVAWSGSDAVDIEKHRRALEEDRVLREEMERLAEGFRVPVTVAVIDGLRVAEELIRYARANAVDLVVVGCREHGAMHPGVGGGVTARLVQSRVAPVLLGPMVPAAHLNLSEVPLGCSVFSRDGFYIGDLAGYAEGQMRIRRHGGEEIRVPVDDAFDLSVASGLHLAFDMVDLDRHIVEGAPA